MKRRKIVTSELGTLDALIINITINTIITRRRFEKAYLFTAHLRETLDPARAFTSSLTPPATKVMLIMMVTIVVTIIVVVVAFGLRVLDTRPPSPIIVMMTIMNVFSLIISIVELGPS